MAKFLPFKAIRPDGKLAEKIFAPPYDVMNRAEAKQMSAGNPYSFLHVTRSEIDLDDAVGAYDERVYAKAKENLEEMLRRGWLFQDETPRYYIYRQVMWGRVQTGLVGCASIDDYISDVIKKHELTRVEKEIDRINNFDACGAHTEPVFLTYRANREANAIVNDWIKFHKPAYDFRAPDGVAHIVWDVDSGEVNAKLGKLFDETPFLYIADGHHRSASSVKVGMKRRQAGAALESDYFLAVAFPDEELFIMDYNRVVRDLNGLTEAEFLAAVGERFTVEERSGEYKPLQPHTFGMLLGKRWYMLSAREGTYDPHDPIARLDVSILQANLLGPVLGIEDPRTDKRIDFVGGIRGLDGLKKRVENDMAVAFAMYPTTIEDLLRVADSGAIMPPKSTWFEPKLASGLFIHKF